MFFKFKHFLKIFTFTLILQGCQLNDAENKHGIVFLENRSQKLTINISNRNDVVRIIGQPHSRGINNNKDWIYIERVFEKGKFYKLGQNVLKTNNILILEFNKYGILQKKVFLDKSHKKKLTFSQDRTENNISKKSFVEEFLSTLKNKMYGRK